MGRTLGQMCPTVCSSDAALLEIGRTISRHNITYKKSEGLEVCAGVSVEFHVDAVVGVGSGLADGSGSTDDGGRFGVDVVVVS
ncbi:hypothetical protein RJ640_009529 [Escallonia rubra]|uniref:Uncharacterized protein n=1 Tax=Escallonia rubra TaxID=112253 RepID=A0AA88UI53_9ASTE|nr:hypothetical protein RJ640_009529 [Escallonia rubra]